MERPDRIGESKGTDYINIFIVKPKPAFDRLKVKPVDSVYKDIACVVPNPTPPKSSCAVKVKESVPSPPPKSPVVKRNKNTQTRKRKRKDLIKEEKEQFVELSSESDSVSLFLIYGHRKTQRSILSICKRSNLQRLRKVRSLVT